MPLFLVKVRRWTRVVEHGSFSIEAQDLDQARTIAKAAIGEKTADIDWEGVNLDNRQPGLAKVEEIELLAEGTEDITEQF